MTREPRPRPHWIPPVALAAGQLAHGISWVLLIALALRGTLAGDLPALGWVHLVALGWLTMTALAILVHVIPGFTDATWKGESVARGSLFAIEAGAVALVVAFCAAMPAALAWAGTFVAIALTVFLVPAGTTLATAFGGEKGAAAIARALTVTLGALFVTALLGTGLAWALAGHGWAALLASGPPAHGALGIIAWLTVLIMGVSMRTVRPISGARSRRPWAHIAAGAAEIAGVLLFATGMLLHAGAIAWFGALTIVLGAMAYIADLADILGRATITHRPPQAFLGAGIVWFVAGLTLSTGELLGQPWGSAAVYVLLVGWIGQMVNGHLHHIGIRLVATVIRGDDDETRPGELLVLPLSWTSFALFQTAVAGGALALVLDRPGLMTGSAAAGLCAWIAMLVNVGNAGRRAANLPLSPSAPPTG